MRLWAAAPLILATISAALVGPAAPAPSAIVEPEDAPVPSEVADPSSETISLVTGAIPLRATDEAEDRLEASAAKEELPSLRTQHSFSLPAAAPVTLTLASATLPPLAAAERGKLSFAPACRGIPAPRAPPRLKVVTRRAIMPVVRAFDDLKAPAPAAAVDVPEPMMLVVARRAEARHLSGHQACGEREDLKRHAWLRYQDGRVQHPREEAAASLQPLQRRADAVHAAADPLRHRAPCRRDPRLSRLAWLRAAPLFLRAKLFEMTSVGHAWW